MSIKEIIKKIYFSLPKFFRVGLLRQYENFYARKTARELGIKINRHRPDYHHKRPRILFYQMGGMGHGGTDKHTQNLARYLDKDRFDVYYMYSEHSVGVVGGTGNSARERFKNFVNSPIHFIRFDYDEADKKYPHILRGMKPDFFEVLKQNEIDLLIINVDGKIYFPANLVRNLPIVMLNVFGSYAAQKNIVLNLCYTAGMIKRICRVVDEKNADWLYMPCESPKTGMSEAGIALRYELGIPEEAMVFGRIGRDVDTIFDTIGIRAFQAVVKKYPEAHYLIMSPPPILKKIVAEEKIPNVHFLPPSSDEQKIWSFHMACDAYAHFRNDGETFGMNIAEAMMCGKPVITHKSFVWNEHLSYLTDSFSRVAEIDDAATYADFMIEFINLKKSGQLSAMGVVARAQARKEFAPEIIAAKFARFLDRALTVKF